MKYTGGLPDGLIEKLGLKETTIQHKDSFERNIIIFNWTDLYYVYAAELESLLNWDLVVIRLIELPAVQALCSLQLLQTPNETLMPMLAHIINREKSKW